MPFNPTAEELEAHFAPYNPDDPTAPHGNYRVVSTRLRSYVYGIINGAYMRSKLNRLPTENELMSEAGSILNKWSGDDNTILQGVSVDALVQHWRDTAGVKLDERAENVPVHPEDETGE